MATNYDLAFQKKFLKWYLIFGVLPSIVFLLVMLPKLVGYIVSYEGPETNNTAGGGLFVGTATIVLTVIFGFVQALLLRVIYGKKLAQVSKAPIVVQQVLGITFAGVAFWMAALCVSDPYAWGVATAFALILLGIPMMLSIGSVMLIMMTVYGKKFKTSAFAAMLLIAMIALLISYVSGSYFSGLMYPA